jgi:excisionase family DNA binding protein
VARVTALAALLVDASAAVCDPEQLVDVKEAAKRLGVHAQTVRAMAREGSLPSVRIGEEGGALRFRSRSLDEYIRRKERPRQPGVAA